MPFDLNTTIGEALRRIGDTTPLRDRAHVGGGCISQALRLRTERGSYMLKLSEERLPAFFAAEARGLALLASTNTVRVPEVLAFHDVVEDRESSVEDSKPGTGTSSSIFDPQSSDVGFILMEWLEAPPNADRRAADAQLGQALAALHRSSAPAYGLDCDNYLGIMPQPNGWETSWLVFFRERRLRHQAALATQNGYWPRARARRFERLLARLDSWIDDRLVQPALIHGDLWGGNYLLGPGGAPALIDPAVYYGDREIELAYTTLFNPLPPAFYQVYDEVWPLPDGWQARRPLYNLYHLVNHLNHFGERYAAVVDQTLQHYVG